MNKRIWDSRLWIRNGIDQCIEKNAAYGDDVSNKSRLGAELLLYDNVIIPTYDFGIVPILVDWCGMNGLIHLLQFRALSFAWIDMMPAYRGGGTGLISYAVGEPGSGWENWRQVARWAPLDESAEAQVDNSIESIWSRNAKTELLDLVLENSFEAQTRDISSIRQETIVDVSTVVELNQWISAAEGGTGNGFNFNHLAGLGPDKIRVVGENDMEYAIDLVLRVAEVNAELLGASSINDCDVGLPFGTPKLLLEKMRRCGATDQQLADFVHLLDLERLPDIRPAIESGEVSIRDIAELRTSRDAEQFRNWLRNTDANDARELERLYLLATRPMGSNMWPVKLLRIASTLGVGVLGGLSGGPAAGVAAGAAASAFDSFFVERWLNGYNPSIFLDNIRALPLIDSHNPERT